MMIFKKKESFTHFNAKEEENIASFFLSFSCNLLCGERGRRERREKRKICGWQNDGLFFGENGLHLSINIIIILLLFSFFHFHPFYVFLCSQMRFFLEERKKKLCFFFFMHGFFFFSFFCDSFFFFPFWKS